MPPRWKKIHKKLGLDLVCYRVLFTLKEKNPQSISDIAFHCLSKVPTTTKITYWVKDEGLVETAVSPEDGQVTLVSLTKKSIDLTEQVEQPAARLFSQAFAGMTEGHFRKLTACLKRCLSICRKSNLRGR